MTKRLINIKELAEYTGIPIKSLYNWVSQKKIPYVKFGRLVRFKLEDIDRIINENTVNIHKDFN